MQQQEKELFKSYEIRNWNYSPRLYKILGAAAIFNVLALLIMGQTNALTTRGCDSPLVGRFCQVIDTIYVGSVLLSTDSGYVDKDYVKDELADAEITYIDVSGVTPPLNYPEGYFAIANRDEFAAMQNMTNDPSMANPIPGIPGFPTNPAIINGGTDLMNTPQVTPTPNKNAVQGNIPTEPFTMTNDNPIATTPPLRNRKYPKSVTPKMPKNASPNKLPKLDGDETLAENKTVENQADKTDKTKEEPKSDPVAEVEINKRPIKDLGVYVNALLNDKNSKFDLSTPFIIEASGKLTKEGKLDPKSYKIKQAASADPQMIEVVRQSIEAMNAAGYLRYLEGLSGKDLNLLLKQDETGITAEVKSEVESANRANTLKGLLNLAIKIAKDKKTDPNDKDDLELLKGASVESDGKQLIIKFAIPNPTAQEMIKRKLLEQTAATKNEPTSTMEINNTNQKTTK